MARAVEDHVAVQQRGPKVEQAVRPMHVMILNQTFWPDHAATAQHMWDLARHLDARGHRVSVVTSLYYYGSDKAHAAAYEKVGRNIHIHRVRGTGLGKKNTFTRLADFGSFYAAAAMELRRIDAPDVTLALTSPPMIAALAMMQRELATGPTGRPVKFVYHVMDLYPDAIFANGGMSERHPVTRVLDAVTAATLRSADAVISLGRDMSERLVRRFHIGNRADRIHVVTPWADRDLLWPIDKRDNALAHELGLADTFNVVYSGNFGLAHDADTIAAAIEATRDDAGLRWVFIGSGKRYEPLKKRAEAAGWQHVRFLPFQDIAKLNQSLNVADVHLISQLPEFTGVVVPSKLFGILAVGKPSVMVGPADAEVSRIITENEAGAVVPNGDAAGLVDAVRTLQSDAARRAAMGRRARAAFERHYAADITCARIESILDRVVRE